MSETALHDGGGGNLYQPIATPSRGSSDLVLVRAHKEHGASSVAHRHDREEVIWVLAGRAWAQIERRTVEMGPGDALIVAAGDLHRSRTEAGPVRAHRRQAGRHPLPRADGRELPLPGWML